MSKETPTYIDLYGPKGEMFARTITTDEGNIAVFRNHDADGNACLRMVMQAHGIQADSVLTASVPRSQHNMTLNALPQSWILNVYGLFKEIAAKEAPHLLDIHRLLSVASELTGQSLLKNIARPYHQDGQDVLVVRINEPTHDVPSLLVVSEDKQKFVEFASTAARDAAFENLALLDAQMSATTSKPRLRTP